MNAPYRQLFEATTINGMLLNNRLVRSATWEGMCEENGRPTAELINIYRVLAQGGVGLIVTGFAYVAADGKPLPGAMGLHDDALAADILALTEAVHQEGGKICVQLGHAGGQTRNTLCGCQPLAPSSVAAPQYHPTTPRAMTPDDIERVTADFAAAAARAKAYGFDAVQLLAAHGYLINQFLSPHTNLRDDGYGGDLLGRCRFLLDILARVRLSVGPDFPVLVKLNADDNLEEGLSLGTATAVAGLLDQAGIDAIEVSSGTPASGKRNPLRQGISSPEEEAYNLSATMVIRQNVRCPLILVGGIRSYWTAKNIIRRGQADFISLCRPLIHEPHLPKRWRWADGETLARCRSCNACYKAAFKGKLSCTSETIQGSKT